MTIQQIRRTPFELAQPQQRLFGLLDVATIRDSGPWMTGGADVALSWNCIQGSTVDYTCAPATAAKTFDAPTLVDASMFYVYLGGECKGPGFGDVETEIRRVFSLRESSLVEGEFEVSGMPTPFAPIDTGAPPDGD